MVVITVCVCGGKGGFATSIQWVKPSSAAQYSTMHRTASTTKSYLAQKINFIEVTTSDFQPVKESVHCMASLDKVPYGFISEYSLYLNSL